MNDDFLHRIRREPSPQFIALLSARLNDVKPIPARRWWGRKFVVASIMAGVALASGIYMIEAFLKPNSRDMPESDVPSSALIEEPGPVRDLVPPGLSKLGAVAEPVGTVPETAATPIRLGVAATVSIAPMVRVATRFMNRNMHVYPPALEATFSLVPSEAIFSSLCGADATVQAIVADRRIAADDIAECRANEKHVAEMKFGYEAVAIVNSNLYSRPKFTARALFLGLARDVPDQANPAAMIPNPYVTWDQIDPALPTDRIDVLGPPALFATGMAFRDSVLKQGCSSVPEVAAFKTSDPQRFYAACGSIRTDGYYRAKDSIPGSAENPFSFAEYLQANPGAVAVMAYGDGNLRSLNLSAASVDDVVPTRETIQSGAYAGSRTLYLYVNKSSQAARNFAFALWSVADSASVDAILTPLDPAERRAMREKVLALPEL